MCCGLSSVVSRRISAVFKADDLLGGKIADIHIVHLLILELKIKAPKP
jgi:hypothetical protein